MIKISTHKLNDIILIATLIIKGNRTRNRDIFQVKHA